MGEKDIRLDIRFRGDAEAAAEEIWRGLRDETGLQGGGRPTRLDQNAGAMLGVGAVIVTLVASAAVQALVQRAVDLLIKKIKGWRAEPEKRPELTVHLVVEVERAADASCWVRPEDSVEEVEAKLHKWRQRTEAELAKACEPAAGTESG